MSTNSKSKKVNKMSRPTSRKLGGQSQSPTFDGIYGDARMVHSLINSMGSRCTVQVRNGDIFSGVFHTVSPQMDIVLAAAHKLESNSLNGNVVLESDFPSVEDIINELIFQIDDIVHVEIIDTNLSFAEVSVKSNGDTGAESKASPLSGSEPRKLEPWDGGGDTTTDNSLGGLDDTFGPQNGTNGWGAEEMFRINSEQYGVQSSYDPDMTEYTTQLDSKNTPDFELRLARADKIAQEMESSPSYMKNINLELDESTTEEDKYSAVVRDIPPKVGRGRARPRDAARDPRPQRPGHHIYPQGPGSVGRPGYGPGTPGRSIATVTPGDAPLSSSEQGKPVSKTSNNPALPPRLRNHHHRDQAHHPRADDERGPRMHEVSHHSAYSSQAKQQRPAGQSRSGPYPKGMSHPQDYTQQPPSDVSMSLPGAHSAPRDQPPMAAWKEDDRMHSTVPPNTTNQPPPRSYPAGVRGDRFNPPMQKMQVIPRILGRPSRSDNTFPTSVPNTGPVLAGHGMQPPVGPYADKGAKQPAHPNYRQTMAASSVAQQPSQSKKYFLSPRGHSPPVMPISSQPHPIFAPTHRMMANPQQQHRYPTVSTTAAPTMQPATPMSPSNRRSGPPPAEGKSSSTTRVQSASTNQSEPAVLKSASVGSTKDKTAKSLQDFQRNFNLKCEDSSSVEPAQETKSSAATRSKSMEEAPLAKSASSQAIVSPEVAAKDPPPSHVVVATQSAEGAVPSIMTNPQQATWSAADSPALPSSNASASAAPPTGSDVVTVSAATGPFTATPPIDQPVHQLSQVASQKVVPAEPSTLQANEAAPTGTTPSTEQDKATGLNPDAKEFTPKFSKLSGPITPQSPSHVTQQPPGGNPYNQGQQFNIQHQPLYVVQQKSQLPKQGQTIVSPSPTDQTMMAMNPHIQPTTVGHLFTPGHPYAGHAAGPLVLTQAPGTHQTLGGGQPAVMHQPVPYSGIGPDPPLVYTPSPGHVVHQATPRAIHPGYPDYGYPHAQSFQLQPQQHASPHHQPQPAVTPQQQPQATQQPTAYIPQQPQQRPHSAHTPNHGLIRPASPATNVQPQPTSTISANPTVQLQHAPNTVIAPHAAYFPGSILTPLPNNPHGSYHHMPRGAQQYMLIQNPPHLPGANQPGQSGHVPTAATTANHNQSQYSNRRQQYHTQPVMPGYQPQTPN